MTMPTIPGRRVVVAGVGATLAAGILVAGPSANADTAATAGAGTAATAPALDNARATGKFWVNSRTHRARARGEIKDTSPRRVRVGVQARIQRKDGRRWTTVYTGPRVVRWEHAVSETGWRRCVRGKVYRGLFTFEYAGRRTTAPSRAFTC
ncbi:hypothetical protein [Actinomadura terrae]|uniref:hypothetical protein n=1 Tax=Actinomadura terrae TaxID=604353 RepID=UPI001FA6B817|nr:hypothetical protein [Actinomadura terrae]